MATKVIINLNDELVSQALRANKYFDLGPLGKPSRAEFSQLDINTLPHLKRLEIIGRDTGLYWFHALFENSHEITLKHYGGPRENGDTNFFEHSHNGQTLAELECRLPRSGGRKLQLFGDGDGVRHYLAPLATFGIYAQLRSEPQEYTPSDIERALRELEFKVTQPVVPTLVHLHSPDCAIDVKSSRLLFRRLSDEARSQNLVQAFEFEYAK